MRQATVVDHQHRRIRATGTLQQLSLAMSLLPSDRGMPDVAESSRRLSFDALLPHSCAWLCRPDPVSIVFVSSPFFQFTNALQPFGSRA